MVNMPKILEVKNLNVSLNGGWVLKDVSFSVEEGKRTGIIGPNGAGKTTLFRALMGLVPCESGEIIWHKEQKIAYVPQKLDIDLNMPLTVKELFLSLSGPFDFWFPPAAILNEIKNTLNHLRCLHLLDKRLNAVSSGELQRILIGYAIYRKPTLLLFDEPTSGVDVEGEETIYDLIDHLAKDLSLTVLLISHDLNVVYRRIDEVICLNKKMICYGPPAAALTTEKIKELYGAEVNFYHHRHH